MRAWHKTRFTHVQAKICNREIILLVMVIGMLINVT